MIFPMFAMVLLTFIIGAFTLTARIKAVKARTVKISYFRFMESKGDEPEVILKTTRHFNNLFETPILFYVVCTLFVALNIESEPAIALAWLFFAFRCLHSFIHLSYNNVLHRMLSFNLANLCTLALWVILVVNA